ncbi:MAG: YkgJ family cysteine cluster protein [Methylovirgula sp.]
MEQFDPKNPLGFFIALHREFDTLLTQAQGTSELVALLMQQVFAQFETHVAHQCEGQAALACRGGCAACCALRVTATAPEVLIVAMHLKNIAAAMPAFAHVLQQRIEAAAANGGGLDEAEYMALAHLCPFIVDGHCVIYELRPLACRGHASFDEAACREAIAGAGAGVPISEPHHLLRGYVQNAMQSALRDAGLPFAIYEFVPALAIALHADAAETWASGEDPFAPSRAQDVSLAEMTTTFDQIKALAR